MIKEYNFTSEEEAYKEGKRLGAREMLVRVKVEFYRKTTTGFLEWVRKTEKELV